METTRDLFARVCRAALKPSDPRPPWQWLAEHGRITNSPFGDRFNFELTPWLKEPFEVFADNRVHQITLQCCVQGAKSTFLQGAGLWSLCNDAGNIAFYLQTTDHAKKFGEERWLPMIARTPAVAPYLSQARFSTGRTEIYFNHAFAYLLAANPSNAQRVTVRYVLADECHLYAPGLLWEIHKRATLYWNRRIVNASTPSDTGSDFDQCWQASDRRDFAPRCQGCGKNFLIDFDDFDKAFTWEDSERTRPRGQWNFDALAPTVRLVCPHCGHAHLNTERAVRQMAAGGVYLRANSNAPSDQVGFRWNAAVLSPSALSWAELAREYLSAVEAWKQGYLAPMREFKTKRGALAHDPHALPSFIQIETIELGARASGPLKLTVDGVDFIHRTMGVDVQLRSFWVLVMYWSAAGDDLAVFAAEIFTWADVAAIQAEYKVADQDVLVDWSHRQAEVVIECCRHGHVEVVNGRPTWICWKAMRGSHKPHFGWKGHNLVMPYDWPPREGDPCYGLPKNDPRRAEFALKHTHAGRAFTLLKQCQIVSWSNFAVKDVVIARRDGRAAVKSLTLKGEWNREYARQLHSQVKKEIDGKWNYERFTDDHLNDCRCMCTVRAFMRHLLGAAP